MDTDKLQESLGYVFRDQKLLRGALTHSSYSKEMGISQSNERLEFLGDAFFDAIIGEELYHMFPKKEEGMLSRIRVLSLEDACLHRTLGIVSSKRHYTSQAAKEFYGKLVSYFKLVNSELGY